MEESLEYPSDSEMGEFLRPAMHVIPLLDASQSLHLETVVNTNVSVDAEVDVTELEGLHNPSILQPCQIETETESLREIDR